MGKYVFLEKWERNRSLILEFRDSMEEQLDTTCGWEKKAFPDSDITCAQYLAALKELLRLEYSDIRKKRLIEDIKEEEYPQHIQNLDAQYEKIKKQKEFLICKVKNC